jgi:hypothetical protein
MLTPTHIKSQETKTAIECLKAYNTDVSGAPVPSIPDSYISGPTSVAKPAIISRSTTPLNPQIPPFKIGAPTILPDEK